MSPFGALGAGGRTYDYRDVGGTRTDLSFKGLRGERAEREARNDVAITAGLTLKLGGR